MKYAFEMGSGAMVYARSYIKYGSGIQNFIGWWGESQTDCQHGDRIRDFFLLLSSALPAAAKKYPKSVELSAKFHTISLNINEVIQIFICPMIKSTLCVPRNENDNYHTTMSVTYSKVIVLKDSMCVNGKLLDIFVLLVH